MEPDYFTNLPLEITTDILSCLSIRSLAISKSVCKPWRDLLESFDFVKSKILVRFYWGDNSTRCTIFEIEDEDEADLESHDLHYHPLTDFEIPHGNTGSIGIIANALLLLHSSSVKGIFICNLITREYTELSYPVDYTPCQSLQFGFGVSNISGKYKVVLINADFHCVYTLGTGTWRRVEAGAASGVMFSGQPILCNGNLHWRIYVPRKSIWSLCGFDVETECYRIFSFPTPTRDVWGNLFVFRDCMCFSYYNKCQDEIVLWMMKEYQVDESWTIEYKISTTGSDLSFRTPYMLVEAIKLFKDGDVLMLLDRSILSLLLQQD